jgi:hypothetical protein
MTWTVTVSRVRSSWVVLSVQVSVVMVRTTRTVVPVGRLARCWARVCQALIRWRVGSATVPRGARADCRYAERPIQLATPRAAVRPARLAPIVLAEGP